MAPPNFISLCVCPIWCLYLKNYDFDEQLKIILLLSLRMIGLFSQTPSGTQRTSSAYKSGYFLLYVSSPVETGSYTCIIPASAPCLHGQHGVEAGVHVEKMEVALLLIQWDNKAIQVKYYKYNYILSY